MTDWANIFDEEFHKRLEALMAEWQVPGVAAVLVPDEPGASPLYVTRGDADMGTKPVTETTRFPIGSLSKLVAAIALDKALCDANAPNHFDTLVKDLLPDFELSDATATEQCTIRDLLGHRTTVPPYNFFLFRPYGPEESELTRLKHLPLSGRLREGKPLYSNIVQTVVRPLIERLTKWPFETYVNETIFEPLAMSASVYTAAEAGEDLATGYQAVHDAEGTEERLMVIKHAFDNVGGSAWTSSSRLISSIEDMARLLKHMRENSAFPEMSVPLYPPEPLEGKLWGGPYLGTGTTSYMLNGHLMSGHYGELAGYRAHILRIPSLKCGVAVLSNSTEGGYVAQWIESWVVGKLSAEPDLHERMYQECLQSRQEEHELLAQEWPSVDATHPGLLLGAFHHPSFGTWTFDLSSNVKEIPNGTEMSTPHLDHLYGSSRPIVVNIGGGHFKGVLEWTPGQGQDQSRRRLYGYKFEVKATEDTIEISGLDAWSTMGFKVPPAVLRRI